MASWPCAHHHFLLAFSLVVAVYIQEAWWATEDVLRTSDPAREGLMKVRACKFPWILQNRFQVTVLIIVLIIESSLPLWISLLGWKQLECMVSQSPEATSLRATGENLFHASVLAVGGLK